MTHFPTLHAMGRRRMIKVNDQPMPRGATLRPPAATVKSESDAGAEVRRDQLQRPAPTHQED